MAEWKIHAEQMKRPNVGQRAGFTPWKKAATTGALWWMAAYATARQFSQPLLRTRSARLRRHQGRPAPADAYTYRLVRENPHNDYDYATLKVEAIYSDQANMLSVSEFSSDGSYTAIENRQNQIMLTFIRGHEGKCAKALEEIQKAKLGKR